MQDETSTTRATTILSVVFDSSVGLIRRVVRVDTLHVSTVDAVFFKRTTKNTIDSTNLLRDYDETTLKS